MSARIKFFRIVFTILFALYAAELIVVTFFLPGRGNIRKYPHYFIPSQGTLASINDPVQYDSEHYWEIFTIGLAGNFMLLLPLSFFLRYFTRLKSSSIIYLCIATSIIIEVLQLLFNLGVCDIDDVILNSAGAFAGIYVFTFLNRIMKFKRFP